MHSIDPELYFDYQYTRPRPRPTDDGTPPPADLARATVCWRPRDPDAAVTELWLLTGVEPARTWQAFAAEFIDVALREDITGFVTLGAMMSDVPHTRPISIFASSDNEQVRAAHGLERSHSTRAPSASSACSSTSARRGRNPDREPVGERAALRRLRHSVAEGHARSSGQPRGADRRRRSREITFATEAAAWEASIDAAAADDEEMTEYIRQLEQTRDTWDSPDASGDAIAQAFERYLKRRGDGPGDHKR